MAQKIPYTAERFTLAKSGKINAETGVIEGVRVCGPKSRNGRRYPESVLKAALPLYAEAASNLGHHPPDQDVPPADRFGRIRNPRIVDGGITADYHFNPKHPFAAQFVWAAENCPDLYSFSHLARVKWNATPDTDGTLVAESILAIASVDLVTDGGTTSTVFESDQSETPEVTVATDPKAVATELTDSATFNTFLTDLFTASTLTVEEKQGAIDALQTMLDSATGEPPADAPADAPAVAAATESLRKRGRIGRWAHGKLKAAFAAESANKRKAWATSLIQSEGLPESARTELLVELVSESYGNEVRAKAIIAERKQFAGNSGGSGKTPARTSPAGGGAAKSVKDLVNDMSFGE